ncbi:hypothetical protein ABEH27_21725 [Pseudomonas sp. P39-UII1]|uniref:hypothetical protein n=1 Tax=Pseudomonas sp. P39-UII1 TaxID=3080333 RepID=UPI0032080E56
MSMSQSQLSQLDREMDQNHLEMVMLPIEHFMVQARSTQTQVSTQPPQVCSRTTSELLTGIGQGLKSTYNGLPHTFVNTTWGVPATMAAWDLRNAAIFVRDMGGVGTKVRFTVHKGKQFVIITGYPGLRQTLNAPRYGIQNAKLISMGIGKYGVRGSSIKGFKLSCWVAVGIEVAEWVFGDEHVMTDLFGGVGVELIKAGIASAVGYAFAVVIGSMATFAVAPVIAGAAMVFAVGWGLNVLDTQYGIKNSVKAGLRYAVDNLENLHQQAIRIRTEDMKRYAEEKITNLAGEIADNLYNEAKRWALRKLQPGDLNLPGWPSMPELPSMPSLPTFNLPKF